MDNNWLDDIALVTEAAASLVPVIGGPLAELITERIPRLRQDRIIEYIWQLYEVNEYIARHAWVVISPARAQYRFSGC